MRTPSPYLARRVIYSGQVQGVGFRYTAVRLAQGLEVTGFVKNLADRTVELVVEGPAGDVEELLRRVAEAMADYIREAQVRPRSPTGGYMRFQVLH